MLQHSQSTLWAQFEHTLREHSERPLQKCMFESIIWKSILWERAQLLVGRFVFVKVGGLINKFLCYIFYVELSWAINWEVIGPKVLDPNLIGRYGRLRGPICNNCIDPEYLYYMWSLMKTIERGKLWGVEFHKVGSSAPSWRCHRLPGLRGYCQHCQSQSHFLPRFTLI